MIIDESGMCTEPQCMVPIVSTGPEQVVLLGDHKQLAPIVIDRRARQLGLGTSLFERHAKLGRAHIAHCSVQNGKFNLLFIPFFLCTS